MRWFIRAITYATLLLCPLLLVALPAAAEGMDDTRPAPAPGNGSRLAYLDPMVFLPQSNPFNPNACICPYGTTCGPCGAPSNGQAATPDLISTARTPGAPTLPLDWAGTFPPGITNTPTAPGEPVTPSPRRRASARRRSACPTT